MSLRYRGKKWHWLLFINIINLSVIAAWGLYCKMSKKKLSHFQFRSQITLCLHKTGPKRLRESAFTRTLPEDVRFNGMHYTLGDTTNGGRCKVCRKNTKKYVREMQCKSYVLKGKSCALKNTITNNKNDIKSYFLDDLFLFVLQACKYTFFLYF